MHELTITQNILKIVLDAVKGQKARRVKAVRLLVGPFSGVIPECVQMYWDVLAKGTCAEGAKIESREAPMRVHCRDCGKDGEITHRRIACHYCGSVHLQRLSGRECTVESLEVE